MSLSGDTTQSSLLAPALLVPLNSSASPHSLPWAHPSHPAPQLQEEWPKNDTRLLANLSLLGPHDDCHMSPILTTCLVVWYSVTMVLGLVGNIGLICIISRCREKANVTSIFICNLSFSDILVCVFCLPFTVIYTLMDHWVFGALMCRLVPFIQCVSVTVSVLSLVFIALERHQLIINPSGWKPSIPQAYTAVLLIWIVACCTSAPFLAFQLLSNEPYTTFRHLFSHGPQSPHMEACMEHWPSPKQRLAYTTWLLVFQYCGPLLLVLLCYVRVFVRLRHRKDMLDRVRTPESQRVTHSRRINIMLVALITAFALCWLPLTIFNVLSDWKQEALPVCHHNLLFSLCHLLAMSSTCINPIIYGFLNSNFRQEVREVILHCRWRPAEESEHYPMSTVQMEMSRTSVPQNCRSNSI
ncbi:neuropeptide Y receptor type 4-2-like [Boleophthalmus pectinirostris]|uniref:neuropeptide Y receptor type 4-2-like n=1 Tax=Boleophthalmus pectinirostris TaxID=150288 RepID=UPI0024330CF4|nr:neuropeptide Y receptor type 4-2-like [Boleophthalmus pectinirostris]